MLLWHRFFFFLLSVLLLTACADGRKSVAALDAETSDAVYYWRTAWRLDSTERAFLRSYHVRRIYTRYFDVVMDSVEQQPMPNATIRLDAAAEDIRRDSLEIVPTVFITEDCMHATWPDLARKLVARVCQMNETHDITGVREMQVDCDFTERSRGRFYDFLGQVREAASQRGMRLSVTVRLHQLAMAPPPADYGVLMLYNTGDPRRWHERNPVLDLRDVKPYLRRLDGYGLPLAAAYPIYLWQRTIHGVRIEHRVEAGELLRVKEAVEHHCPALSRHIILFHLDKNNIELYDSETFTTLFSH